MNVKCWFYIYAVLLFTCVFARVPENVVEIISNNVESRTETVAETTTNRFRNFRTFSANGRLAIIKPGCKEGYVFARGKCRRKILM